MDIFFEFEKPIITLEKKLTELREIQKIDGVDFADEILILEKKLGKLIQETYSKLSRWNRVQLSRHPSRPYTSDYIEALFPDFMEIHGDRKFGEDAALVMGTATLSFEVGSFPVLVLGHQKGRTTKQKVERNFGMVRPEGYRKAIRGFELAERFRMPVISFIDTPGAYPGMDAEERGQSQAIAECITKMFSLTVPSCSIVIGEGGSGGALAIGIGNLVLMQEFSTYSVISPESCASILWSDSTLAEKAAEKLKITAEDLKGLKVIDGIISEPHGGAHRDFKASMGEIQKVLKNDFLPMLQKDFSNPDSKVSLEFKNSRHKKFRSMGNFALREDTL